MLDRVNKQFIREMVSANAPYSMIRNVIHTRTGHLVSPQNRQYIHNTSKDIADNDRLFISGSISPIDRIIFKCKERNYDYMSLFQDPKVSPEAISCNYMSETKNEEQTSFTGLSLYEKESLNHFINV